MQREEAESYLHKKVEDGELISPVLPEGIKNYLIDIDGTICDDIPNEEPERMATAKLYPDALETLNKWYDEGHLICFFTSRVEAHRKVTSSKSDVDVVLHNHCIDAKIGNIFSAESPSKFKASPKFLEVVGFLQLLLFYLPMRHPQLLQL